MSDYVLLTYNEDWADEFDATGLRLMEKRKYEIWKKVHEFFGNMNWEWYFGTNEFMECSAKEFCDQNKVIELTDDQVEFFRKNFKFIEKYRWGNLAGHDALVKQISEEIEEYDLDEIGITQDDINYYFSNN